MRGLLFDKVSSEPICYRYVTRKHYVPYTILYPGKAVNSGVSGQMSDRLT